MAFNVHRENEQTIKGLGFKVYSSLDDSQLNICEVKVIQKGSNWPLRTKNL